MATNRIKHLSSMANQVIQRSALRIGSSVEELMDEFDGCIWNDNDDYENNNNNYGKKLVEYCGSKALKEFCQSDLEEKISDGSFSRFTFDLMLAWEMPISDQHHFSTENVAKGKEDRKKLPKEALENDDIPLFYSDIMPLLVTDEPGVGEDAFVWLGTLVPLVTDVVNSRFTFETLTASMNNRLHFPAYDKFLREIDKSIKHLAKQAPPKGAELRDDEFILHIDGTASSQRVVRHIGGTSWPGRLTLTNYALYFEASGVITYEDAIKIDLSKHDDDSHSVKPAATGPFGAPLFDKAIAYESSEFPEGMVLEFPEITSSTRRDHWLALITEVLLLHKFLLTFQVACPIQAWEMHARMILGVVRLHAAREMMRISSPDPKKFLIFALLDEIPKGDHVLEKLAESLGQVNCMHPCSTSSILRRMNVKDAIIISTSNEKGSVRGVVEDVSSLESAIIRAREEEKEIAVAKATAEELKQEGIADSAMVLIGLLMPLKRVFTWFQEIVMWERPSSTLLVVMIALIVAYREWVGKAIAALLMWMVAMMICARQKRLRDECSEIVVNRPSSDQSTMESIVLAQHGLRTVYETVQMMNVSILKLWSIFISKAPKHADMVMIVMSGVALLIALIPTKYIVMSIILYCFTMTSKLGQNLGTTQDNRRLREWWESIPVIPVRIADVK